MVELKTAKALADEHSAQVLGYLKSVRLEHSLLINFGSYRFELRKFAWSQKAARRKLRPSFLFSAFSAFFAVNPRRILSYAPNDARQRFALTHPAASLFSAPV
jgi:hypothetical protein